MTKLWVKFQGYNATQVSTEECQDVDDFLKACKKTLSHKLDSYGSGQLSLATTEGGQSLRPGLLLTEIPSQPGYAENGYENPLFISVPGDASALSSKRKVEAVITELVKKPRLSTSEDLVRTEGRDFVFSDRQDSFAMLAERLVGRQKAVMEKKGDRNLHPMPFLSDGPGCGKSRFLQELPRSFRDFVANSEYPEGFKTAISNAVFINITFGNGSIYCKEDFDDGIEKAVCRRILKQVSPETVFEEFVKDLKAFYSFSSLFDHFIHLVSEMSSKCVVLGVDDVNQIRSFGVGNPLRELVSLLGSKSCQSGVFFVPVIAGTTIGRIKRVITNHPTLHIPLPLLSYDSCLAILAKKDPEYANPCPELRKLVSDIGGHCRALEILYVALGSIKPRVESRHCWNDVFHKVCKEISSQYDFGAAPMEEVIAKSFLSKSVVLAEKLKANPSLSYQDLEEIGLVKVENDKPIVPYIFACSFFLTAKTAFSKFWNDLLIANNENFWRQDWAVSNVQYITFRLSLYSALSADSLSLMEFFRGCKHSIPFDIFIRIPSMESIKFTRIAYHYPLENPGREIPSGTCVLNGDGAAPFDGFCYLNVDDGGGGGGGGGDGKRLLLALQMKFASPNSSKSPITNSIIHEEYEKAKSAIANHLPETDFVFILMGRGDGDFDKASLPPNCVVISDKEKAAFYGGYR